MEKSRKTERNKKSRKKREDGTVEERQNKDGTKERQTTADKGRITEGAEKQRNNGKKRGRG